jgi:hypothetical protein
MLNTLRNQYLAIIWAAIVLILCDVPLDDSPAGITFFEGFDKLVHTGFFFVFTVLLFYGKIRQQRSYHYRIITVIKILIVTTMLGGGIELLQLKVFTYRSADWWDLFSDLTGVGMGIFSYIVLHRTRFHESNK